MRVLNIIRSLDPVNGGPAEGLRQIAIASRRLGQDQEVLTLDAPGAPWLLDFPTTTHAVGPGRGTYGYTPELTPWLRKHGHEYDAVVVHGLWQWHGLATRNALQGTGIPYFVFPHGMLDPWFRREYPLKHLKKLLYWPWAEYRVLRDATAVLFTCEDERRLARQSFWLYKCDEYVVNYGTSAPVGDAEVQRRVFLERFPHLVGKRCLLFLGRVHVKKGPDLLLSAFAALLKRLPFDQARDLHIVMAGPADDAYGVEMKALATSLGLERHITWTGMVSGDLKWGAFHSADAFILPSHQENFGIAVAEALACAVPVLISNQVNIWREVQQAGAGLVDSDDLPGTQRLLDRWVQAEPAAWAQMKRDALACFNQRFVIERSAESFIKAMEIYGLRRHVPARGFVNGAHNEVGGTP